MPEPRNRTLLAHVLSWFIPPLLVLGLACHWVGTTASDSDRFAARLTRMLDSEPVRASVATEITDTLVRHGRSSAANFRPAYQLALESLVRTDAFRTVFHDTLLRSHRALFAGSGTSSSLDLSATMKLLSANLQIQAGESTSAADAQESALRSVFPQWTEGLANIGVVEFAARIELIGWGLLILALAVATGVVLLHPERRRGLVRIGAILAVSGVAAAFALAAGASIVVNLITDDAELAAALNDGFRHVATELAAQSKWLIGIGAVLVIAAHVAGVDRATPTWGEVRRRLNPMVRLVGTGKDRRLILATLFIAGSLWGATHVGTVVTMAASMVMLLMVFVGCCQLAAIWPRLEPRDHHVKSLVWAGARMATGMIVLLAVIAGTVSTTWSVASERSLRIDTPEGACNGSVANCAILDF